MADPLVMDVLSDDRTLPLSHGRFVRGGVIYEFTEIEIQEAITCAWTGLWRLFVTKAT